MAVKIGSNIASLTVQRRLGQAASTLERTYERLSSGRRINRAADDAAGLAISKTLDANAKIFHQGIRNLNDGISYVAVAGGALKELKSILYRQRELATQSANGTYSDTQRAALQTELEALSSEWNRMLDSTTFNGRKIFSTGSGSLTFQGGVGIDATLDASFGSTEAAAQDDTTRVSTASNGTQANGNSQANPSISADGRYIVFDSLATNLVSGDTNGGRDIFLKDLLTGETTRVSTNSSGTQANSGSSAASISADGRYVTFTSLASNLVAGDSNFDNDVFIKDLQTGELRRVSTSSSGAEGDNFSHSASVSADGRYVTFVSYASNLVTGDGNGTIDAFVKDMQTGQTRIVSVSSSGTQGNDESYSPVISADGRYVAFTSMATNLVAGDTNGAYEDIFVRDLQTGTTTLVSTSSGGTVGEYGSTDPAISADGRYVVFTSGSSNLVGGDTNGESDVFVKDLQTGETRMVSTDSNAVQGSGASGSATISSDGRYVAFVSSASNLVVGDTNGTNDIFIKDLQTGEIRRVSTSANGLDSNNESGNAAVSADGRYVSYYSYATNLVPGDTNGFVDIFVSGSALVDWSTVSRNQWLDVSTKAQALLSQTRLDNYLIELNTVEGTIGAIEARLGTAVSNLQSMTENFRAAESRIRDADMGQEAANLTRTQIVQQAASAVLAQANQQPEIALQLL